MKIKSFSFNPLSTNCYVVYEGEDAWIIDPSFCSQQEFSRLKQFLLSENLQVSKVLCTHLHFDHIFGAKMAAEHFSCDVYAHINDEAWLAEVSRYANMFGLEAESLAPGEIKHLYQDDTLLLGESTNALVLEVPGHSQGGLAFYFPGENIVFAGDSLFAGSIGRTDLPGGDYSTLIDSIRHRLLCLPDFTTVYCGHGPSTSIAHEKTNNPFL